jgi:hypothetical protein
MLRRFTFGSLLFVYSLSVQAADSPENGWTSMFDGKTLAGWKINENEKSWKVEDGAIVANGPRSHLFYVGEEKPFVNFEFEAEVMTKPNANSGIYFHTTYQEKGWPKYGIEAQVNNSYRPDPIKTASLYKIKDITTAPAKDDTWFKYNIRVEGKHVVVKIDDKTVVDYTQPDGAKPGRDFTRVLGKGTFCLQAHDPGSKVLYRNLKVRRLP